MWVDDAVDPKWLSSLFGLSTNNGYACKLADTPVCTTNRFGHSCEHVCVEVEERSLEASIKAEKELEKIIKGLQK